MVYYVQLLRIIIIMVVAFSLLPQTEGTQSNHCCHKAFHYVSGN